MYALTNALIYTENDVLNHHAIIIEGEYIIDICPKQQLPAHITTIDLHQQQLVPGFIDLQVNGCGGVQFNDTMEAVSIATLATMCHTNQLSGCTAFLPTLITSSDVLIKQAVTVIRTYQQSYPNQVIGLHLEGPYINQEKKGTHNPHFIRSLDAEMCHYLCDNADIIRLITLAPEVVNPHYITALRKANITLAAGHSMATYTQASIGFNAGITITTHLYNAMSGLTAREPGLIGATLQTNNSYATIIADGYHVAWPNIKLAKQLKQDHLILVTDATAAAGSSLHQFQFAGKTIYHQYGKCVDHHGTLSGSALTMLEAIKNCLHYADIPLAEVLNMASLYPAKAIGIADKFGSISIGKIANLVILNNQLTITASIINGKMKSHTHFTYQ